MKAILHIPHLQCELAMAEMLSAIGYQPYGIGGNIVRKLNTMKPQVSSKLEPRTGDLKDCDLFVVVKHYMINQVLTMFPFLKDKLLWFDINGGVPDQHIKANSYKTYPSLVPAPYASANKRYTDSSEYNVSGPRYICYPPLHRSQKQAALRQPRVINGNAICLVHNPYKWGYGWIVDPLRRRGVRFYGSHKAPMGLLPQGDVLRFLSGSLCYVHAKSHDCPGYSLYQSMLVGCPVIVTSEFVKFTRFTDLYVHEETCLIAEDSLDPDLSKRALKLTRQFVDLIDSLKDPVRNKKLGEAGRDRLLSLMWSPDRKSDVDSFRTFINNNFGPKS